MQIDASIMKLQVLWESIKKIWKYEDIPYKDIIWLKFIIMLQWYIYYYYYKNYVSRKQFIN